MIQFKTGNAIEAHWSTTRLDVLVGETLATHCELLLQSTTALEPTAAIDTYLAFVHAEAAQSHCAGGINPDFARRQMSDLLQMGGAVLWLAGHPSELRAFRSRCSRAAATVAEAEDVVSTAYAATEVCSLEQVLALPSAHRTIYTAKR